MQQASAHVYRSLSVEHIPYPIPFFIVSANRERKMNVSSKNPQESARIKLWRIDITRLNAKFQQLDYQLYRARWAAKKKLVSSYTKT